MHLVIRLDNRRLGKISRLELASCLMQMGDVIMVSQEAGLAQYGQALTVGNHSWLEMFIVGGESM